MRHRYRVFVSPKDEMGIKELLEKLDKLSVMDTKDLDIVEIYRNNIVFMLKKEKLIFNTEEEFEEYEKKTWNKVFENMKHLESILPDEFFVSGVMWEWSEPVILENFREVKA